jgi:hypothetical protein
MGKTVLFLLTQFVFISAYAGEWAVTGDGCKVWNKLPAPNESVVWEGRCVNGFVEGKGKLTWIDIANPPEVHEGVWVAGKLTGFAVSTFPGGDRYLGGYVDGEREGWGVYLWKNGAKYIGKFKNGNFDGVGVKKNTAGLIVEEGLWAKGKLIHRQKFVMKDFQK